MDRIQLLPKASHEYKANLHTHTTRSDGALTPEQICELYRANGYSVVAFTDHRTFHDDRALCTDDFLALSGYELDFNEFDPVHHLRVKTCHINAIARDPETAVPVVPGNGVYDVDGINDVIARLKAGGFLVNLNHIAWSNQTVADALALHGFTGMELYNSTCVEAFEGMGELHCYMQTIRSGARWKPLATDDVHHGAIRNGHPMQEADGCRAFVMLRAEELTPAAVFGALESGSYYCSNGPRIYDAYIEGDRAVVDCSPVNAVYVKTRFPGYHRYVYQPSDTLTHVEIDLTGLVREPFIMLQLTDTRGNFACTVPYYFD